MGRSGAGLSGDLPRLVPTDALGEHRFADLFERSATRHAVAGLDDAFTDEHAGAYWLSSFVVSLLTRDGGGIPPGRSEDTSKRVGRRSTHRPGCWWKHIREQFTYPVLSTMGLSVDELDPPLDDLAFLSRSNNRIAVLRELTRDDRTRRELRDATGVSRPTLGRILNGFEERGWIANTGSGNGHDYSLTPIGHVIVEEFTGVMATVETVQKLRELAPRIPFDELGLDPRDLADARITTPSPTDATAHTRRERELLARTSRIRFLCNQAQPETVERYRNWAVDGDREFEAIISGDAIDAATADEAMAADLADMRTAGGVTLHRYEGPVSAVYGLFEDVASVVPLDDSGVPIAFVESESETVRAAVSNVLDRYRERAEPVTVEGHTH